VREPGVGGFLLPAGLELLAEDAVLVPDAVTGGRDLQRRQRVHEAGREPAEPSVAQPGLDLGRAEDVEVEAETGQRLARRGLEVGGQQGVVELPTEQVLRRQVADEPRLRGELPVEGGDPAGHQGLAHRAGQGHVAVVRRGPSKVDALAEPQLLDELTGENVGVGEVPADLGQRERHERGRYLRIGQVAAPAPHRATRVHPTFARRL